MTKSDEIVAHAVSLSLVALLLTITTSHAQAGFELPQPSGRYQVGTTTWRLTDNLRKESFSDASESRQVEVLAWYPAALSPVKEVAPYLREGLAEVRTFALLIRAPEHAFDALANVRTHAMVDGAPVTSTKLPVLVFSHGYTASPSAYTALLEDLASHGYVVLSVVHPYEAAAATLADGRVVTLLDESNLPRKGVRDVFAEWGPEEGTMDAVTRAANEEEQRRLLRQYLSGLAHTDAALRRWVDDTKLVIDRLSSFPATSLHGRITAAIDLNRLGVFGHSMGGVTAAQFCVDDRRCRAALNFDGIPQYGTMIDKQMRRPFLMVYSGRTGRQGASDAIYRRSATPYYRVDVRDTLHLEFSDMPFWGAPLAERANLGKMPPARAHVITAAIVREFFGETLRGERSSLLQGKPPFPEVTTQKMAAP